ncbi:MAG: myo-inosose-2 dehydratase [Eubacteriales bacterium]|nr:myo-inosose-2 dehydratase [Eubacteriales bacterium]
MFEGKNVRVGIAPLTWSNDDMPSLGEKNTFEQCLSETALAGFEGTEMGRKFPEDMTVLKRSLDIRGMRIGSRWFSSTLCEGDFEENEKRFLKHLVDLAVLNGERIHVGEVTRCTFTEDVPLLGDHPVATKEELDRLCDGLNKLGKLAIEHGIKLCFHPHMGTVVQNREETKYVMDHTEPKYVYLCFDSGHTLLAGDDPAAVCEEFADRIGHVHLKDIRKKKMEECAEKGWKFRDAVVEGCFTIPGDGCIEFTPIFMTLDKVGYEGWLMVEAEQDPAKANPYEYALKARHYIRNRTGI